MSTAPARPRRAPSRQELAARVAACARSFERARRRSVDAQARRLPANVRDRRARQSDRAWYALEAAVRDANPRPSWLIVTGAVAGLFADVHGRVLQAVTTGGALLAKADRS